ITGPNAATSAGTGTDGATIEAGTTAAASFSADESVTWTLGGTDAGLFQITTGGVLSLKDPGAVGTYVVEITAEDAAGNISVLTFTLTVERATYIEARADKSTGIANSADAVEITVTLIDENDLPVIGKAVELTTNFGTLFINPSGNTVLTRDNGDGTYTAFLRSDEPGEARITVTIDGVDQPDQLIVEFILIGETGSALAASPSEIRANGIDTTQITVSLYDAEGALLPAGGDTVVLTSTLGILSAVTDNGNGTYSATLTASTEVGVATVTGTVNGIAIAAPATVSFTAYQQAVRDAFTDVTSTFIQRRMDRILSAEPRAYHLDRRRDATSRPQFSLEYQGNAGGLASRLQLAGQLGDMPRGGLDITASEASPSSFLRFSGSVGSTDRAWYVWTEGQISAYQDATGTLAQRDGGFGIVFVGIDHLVNERLSFGVMAHLDRASERIDSYSEVSGNGWMIGPYLSAELAEGLFFSGRVARGQSRNSASIDVFSDNTEWRGTFGTERFLVRGALYGSYELGRARLMPQVDLAYMREDQGDHVVSDGVSEVSVAGARSDTGRLTFSTELEWPVESTFGAMNAFVLPRLDRDFQTPAQVERQSQTRGSLELGLRTTPTAGWRGEAAVRYDGIGQPGFSAWNLRLGGRFDF
ncbi:invasin domain 3-containing protein, partial [Roseicyclus amphidinii]|uniref:invasin domain 3-containing protein n=1 Tax=Roseicyclus amphidinii TaxID=3034232 RepID=UPI0024E04456